MAHPVIHFEIAANDPAKLKTFYSGLFGWSIESIPGMPDYMMVKTTEEGGQGIDGGIMRKQMPQQANTNYVMVESVAEYAEKAKKLGAQVIVPKTAVPKMGWFVVCLDPDGIMIGLWEMDPEAA